MLIFMLLMLLSTFVLNIVDLEPYCGTKFNFKN